MGESTCHAETILEKTEFTGKDKKKYIVIERILPYIST